MNHLFPAAIGTAYIVIFLAMTALSIIAWRSEIITPRAALLLALIACICLGFALPYTSNDSERYLWDGAVFLSGLDPYVTAPNDPAAPTFAASGQRRKNTPNIPHSIRREACHSLRSAR